MVINFPKDPLDGFVYPDLDTGLVFQYAKDTNSWVIVGPDNTATTDWVLAQMSGETNTINKSYDIISATSTVTLETNLTYVLATSCEEGPSGLDAGWRGETSPCDDPNGGGPGICTPGDGLDKWESIDNQLPDFVQCIVDGGKLNPGEITLVGFDDEVEFDPVSQQPIVNHKYKDIVLGVMHLLDSNSESIAVPFADGDVLEFSLEVEGKADGDYGVYTINGYEVHSSGQVAYFKLYYEAASAPDRDIQQTVLPTSSHLFKVYRKALNTGGGTVEGPLRIKYEDEEVFSVRRQEGQTTALEIDTKIGRDGYVFGPVEYELGLTNKNDDLDNPRHLVTLGHLNQRMGTIDFGNTGPWLKLAGGETSGVGPVVIKAISTHVPGNKGQFVIKGRVPNGPDRKSNLLHVKVGPASGEGDYIEYMGNIDYDPGTNPFGLVNVYMLNDKALQYVPRAGGTMTNAYNRTGCIVFAEDGLATVSGLPMPSQKRDAAPKQYVDEAPMGPVHKGRTETPGMIWTNTSSGDLYFNQY